MSCTQRERRAVGLDAHPDVFTAAILAGSEAPTARIVTVSASLPLTQLEAWFTQHTRPEDQIALEASGNSFDIQRRLAAIGRNAQVLESRRAGQITKAYCAHDKGDAIKIARIWLSGLAHVVWTPDETTQLRRDILHRYRRAVTDDTRCRNRVRSFLSDRSIRLPAGTRLTRPYAHADILQHPRWKPEQRELLQGLFEDMNHAHARRVELRRTIARQVANDPTLRILLRLFGVREILAFSIGAIIGDIRRFRTAKQLVAYIGLNPRVAESGTSESNGPLSHHGRKDLRSLLIEAAHALLKYDNPLYRWGVRLKIRKGHNVAVAAVARKLTVAIWYLLSGMFTPLQEINATLRGKILKLSALLGRPTIRQMGYVSPKDFQEQLSHQLLTSTA
jgi:transposase